MPNRDSKAERLMIKNCCIAYAESTQPNDRALLPLAPLKKELWPRQDRRRDVSTLIVLVLVLASGTDSHQLGLPSLPSK